MIEVDEIKNNGATPDPTSALARRIIQAFKRSLERERALLEREHAMRHRLEELRRAREQHVAFVLHPAFTAYAEARMVDYGYDAAIGELERALQQKEGE